MVKLMLIVVLAIASSCLTATVPETNTDWWKTAVFYQIYPRSFMDSDGDGIGDLQGIISKLSYLQELGVTAVWLSPIFESPQKDMGYDISNYRKIDSKFGTDEDFDQLIKEANEKGIKIILDFVPNHTSDQHEWFQKSLAGDEQYKDYYIWMEGKNNKKEAPNNWRSLFQGSAWTKKDERNEYYLHQFSDYQPDLNYRNPNVVKEMENILTFWLDKGVHGFRIDAVPFLIEDSSFDDEPVNNKDSDDYNALDHTFTMDQNETYEIIYSWRKLVDEYSTKNGGDQRVLMTEAYTTFDKTLLYYGTPDGSVPGAHFTFNFDFITSVNTETSSEEIVKLIKKWFDSLPEGYVYNWVVGNHDNHRIATRLGSEHADAFNMLNAILPGIQVTYNGEELGMEDGQVLCNQTHDPQFEDGKNCDNYEALGRDFERTPFQWDDTDFAGFTNVNATPWLPVADTYKNINVKKESSDSRSHLKTYQSLIKLRKVLPVSEKVDVSVQNKNIIVVSRIGKGDCEAYHYLYNRNGQNEKITLTSLPNSKKATKFDVVVSSLNSNTAVGNSLGTEITVLKNEALIVKEICTSSSHIIRVSTGLNILFIIIALCIKLF